MSEPDAAPYEALAALAEQELLLVSSGDLERLDELAGIAVERTAIVAALGARPPAVAESALMRAAATQERTSNALALRAAELRRSLADVDRGRRTARGYGAGPAAARSLDEAC